MSQLQQKMLNVQNIKKSYTEKSSSLKDKIKGVKLKIEKRRKDKKIAETLELISKL